MRRDLGRATAAAAGAQQGPVDLSKLPQFNRKFTEPSRLMHPSDGRRYRCPWIEDSITIHADGNVTCGLDDSVGQRSFGNINRQRIDEIFANPEYTNLQRKLWKGHRCIECGLYQREPADRLTEMVARPKLPKTVVVEPTVKCNLRCDNVACFANNDSGIQTRDADFLNVNAFKTAVDQLRRTLTNVYFFNYGDPFVHAQAEDMLVYLRKTCPDVEVVTSTNGIPLAKLERARKVVGSGVDFMVFTIGGIHQESYSRYHARGRSDQALQGLKNVLLAKAELGATKPFVNWRYLLFRWNDSAEEVEEALRIAEEYAVDEFTLYLTHVPPGSSSFRFSPGSPNFTKFRKYIASALAYTYTVGAQDRYGFYGLETIDGLGQARWTGWQAMENHLLPRPIRASSALSHSEDSQTHQDMRY